MRLHLPENHLSYGAVVTDRPIGQMGPWQSNLFLTHPVGDVKKKAFRRRIEYYEDEFDVLENSKSYEVV